MSSKTSTSVETQSKEVTRIFYSDILSSSSESFEEIPSIPSSENPKMLLYQQGLFDPGSGEICTKYIPLSASSVLRHPYYNYPGIEDPGIKEALLGPEPRKIYPLDGQELYLDLCEEMKVSPVRSFLRGMLTEAIDLKYYGVNPNAVRAMSMALTYNRYVRRLDLTSNFLNEEACYHLGQMLRENMVLQELILCGCRIQGEGLRRLVMFLTAHPLDMLDLSRNDIGDNGFGHLAAQITKGAVIKRLNLSYNNLSSVAALAFSAAIEGNNKTTHLDLSWNKMSSLKEINELLGQLSESTVMVELNLSWNGLKISRIFKRLLLIPTLQILDLNNNRLGKQAANIIGNNMHNAISLHTLDLSYNPLTADGALIIVDKLRNESIKLTNLLMDNVEVNKEFVEVCKEVLELSFRKKCKITYGKVKHNYTLSVPDIREILLKRMDFLTARGSTKHQTDIAIYFLQKKKVCSNIQPREIMRDMKVAGTPLDEALVVGLTDLFPGPKLDKGGKTMDLAGVVEMVHRMWPDRQPPPTPEPDPNTLKKSKKKKKAKSKS